MIQVQLFNFAKRKNSTKQPDLSQGAIYNGELKNEFTLTGLQVTFNFGKLDYNPMFNYAYISYLRRYYFITDWIYANGLWIATLAVDVLATYKTQIGASAQYVTRSQAEADPSIIDTEYMTHADNLTRNYSVLSPTDFWGANAWADNGTVVLGVIGNSSSGVGAVTYYAMSMQTLRAFLNTMLGSVSWANISVTEISEELQKALINPTQYIVSCRWFPILFTSLSVGVSTTNLALGWWNFTLSGSARVLTTIYSAFITRTQNMAIPKYGAGKLEYLNLAPYADYTLEFFPFGVFNIDSTELFGNDTLDLRVDLNLMTGDAILKVGAHNSINGNFNPEKSFLVVDGQIGVPLPVGQVSANIGNYKNALLSGLAGAGGEIAAMLGG